MMSKKNLTWQNAPEMLKTSEAASLINCHLNSIQNWVKTGKLPAEKIGAHWRIRKSDLAAHVGVALDANGRIASDDGRLLGHYANRFDRAIARLRRAQAERADALIDIQNIVDEMRHEGGDE